MEKNLIASLQRRRKNLHWGMGKEPGRFGQETGDGKKEWRIKENTKVTKQYKPVWKSEKEGRKEKGIAPR